MNELDREDQFAQMRRTRRNLMAMAAIAGTALLARTKRASADPDDNNGPDGDNDDDDKRQCFLRGTHIRTASGWRKVEELAIGDLVPTLFGGVQPIQWIGSYRYGKSEAGKPWLKSVRPVRIARSALAPDVPRTDLFLTQAHGIYVDGALVEVGSLINGSTIALYPAEEFDELEFFHVKLKAHDVIEAEGASCETLLEVDEHVSNFADYFRRYGASADEGLPCLPVLSYGGSGRRQIQSRFRSAISPWLDRRQEIDVIRDRLEERALALGLGVAALS
jgi:hypothetical protein